MRINIEQNIYRPLFKNMPMSDVVTGALIDAGSSLVGGIAGMFGQSDANKRNYEQQLALLQNQQQFTNQMWEKQTRENRQSIVNQMSQYRQLGINPLAVTGGVQQSNQTAPSAPSAPQSQYRNPMEGAQIAVLMSEAMKNVAEAKRTEGELPKQEAETAYTWSQQKTEEAMREKRLQIAGIDVKLGSSKVRLTDEQTKEVTQHIENMVSEKERVDSAIQNERLISYDDYIKTVDSWLHNRAEEQKWSSEVQQQWKQLAIDSYRVQVYAKDVASLIEQRQHMNELTDAQKEQVNAQTEKIRKECEKLGYEVDFEKGTIRWRMKATNMSAVATFNASKAAALQDALTYEWISSNPGTYMTYEGVEHILSPLNGVLQMIGLGYGISRMGAHPKGSVNGMPYVPAPTYTSNLAR